MHQNYHLYIDIKHKTYFIYEIYYKKSLARLFKHEILLRDLQILQMIAKHNDLPISDITQKFHISYSNLSNRFNILEEKGFLKRQKNKIDLRKTNLILTPKALNLLEKYYQYTKNFIISLRKKFSSLSLLAFVNFLVKVHNDALNYEPKLNKLKMLSQSSLILMVFDELQQFFIHNELASLESSQTTMTYQHLFFLVEIYLNQKIGHLSLPKLADYLKMSYQTLNSLIYKLIELNYISKNAVFKVDKFDLFIFDQKVVHLIDNFINTRIINYNLIMKHATPKEEKIVLAIYDYLKVSV